MSAPSDERVPWRAIGRVTAATLLFFIAFGALLPVFPLWVARYAESHAAVGMATTLTVGVGLIAARPVAARLMEGRRRAPTLMLGALLSAVVSLAFPALESFAPIVVLRALHGFGFGLVTTAAMSAVTDLAPPARRGQVMGYFGATNALSLLVGPFLGGVMWRAFGEVGTFGACAAGCLLAALSVIGLREPPKPPVRGAVRVVDALAVPGMRIVVGGHFLAILLHGGLITFLPVRMAHHPGWMTPEAFYAIDAAVLIGLRVAVGRGFDAVGRARFVGAGLLCLALGGVLAGAGGSDGAYVLAAVLYGLGFGAYMPAISARVGDLVPPTHRARGFAAFMLSFDLSLALGGVAVGPLADHLGVGAALVIAAAFPLAAMALHLLLRRHDRRTWSSS